MNVRHPVSRRRFLRGVGGTAVALPHLPSLMGESWAAGKAPRRFIYVGISNGESVLNWYPQTPQPWKQLDTAVREAPLSGPDAISSVLGPSLAPFKSKLLLLRGLDFVATPIGGHKIHAPLNGWVEANRQHVSIDQLMAFSPAIYPTPPAIGQPRSLHLLIRGAQDASYVSTAKNGAAVPAEIDVTKSWNTAFGNFVDPMTPVSDAEVKRRALRLKLMDRVRGEYQKVKANPRLGAEDRKQLEAHLTYLDDLDSRLQQTPAVTRGCMRPAQPPSLGQGSSTDETTLPTLTKINIDLLAAAIKCDRTRVATLQLCPETDLRSFSFLPGGPIGGHHPVSHSANSGTDARLRFAKIHTWYADQVAYLLAQLSDVEDPVTGATYLDNSIVYWGNSDGCSDQDVHANRSHPVLLAGSLGGTFRTGRYVDYRVVTTASGQDQGLRPYYNPTNQNRLPPSNDIMGRPYNSLLITLMQAMGMQPSEWELDGPGFGIYSGNVHGQYSIADGQKELPYLRA